MKPLYVPILKAKRGELTGLEQLSSQTQSRFLPIFEIPPIPWDHDTNSPKFTVDEHLQGFPEELNAARQGRRMLIDLRQLEGEMGGNGRQPLLNLFDDCRSKSVEAVPVVNLQLSQMNLEAAAAVALQDRRGVGLRLFGDEIWNATSIAALTESLLDDLHIGKHDVDLIVDVGAIRRGSAINTAAAIGPTLNALRVSGEWRNFVVAAAGYPEEEEVAQGSVELLPRTDWELWQAFHAFGLNPVPTFGDYGITSGEHPSGDFRFIDYPAKIRYTTETDWLVIKGRSLKKYKYQQYHEMAQVLIEREEYRGPEFSWGDQYISDCATHQSGPGTPEIWVKVGTNHHVQSVVTQLANWFGL